MELNADWVAAIAAGIAALIGVVLLVVNAFQGWVANKQLAAMIEANKQTRELFDMVERPIVVVDHADFVGGLDAGKPLLATVKVTNKGRTGAKDIVLKLDPHLILDPEVLPVYARNISLHLPFLASGDSVELTVGQECSIELLGDVYRSVCDKRVPIVIAGQGIYLSMDRRHKYSIAEFAFRYDVSKGFIPNYQLPNAWYQKRRKAERMLTK